MRTWKTDEIYSLQEMRTFQKPEQNFGKVWPLKPQNICCAPVENETIPQKENEAKNQKSPKEVEDQIHPAENENIKACGSWQW